MKFSIGKWLDVHFSIAPYHPDHEIVMVRDGAKEHDPNMRVSVRYHGKCEWCCMEKKNMDFAKNNRDIICKECKATDVKV